MKVIYGKLPFKKIKCVVTIGVFDGIHLGHQFILKKVKEKSQKKGFSSLVITFDIPPRKFLSKNSSYQIQPFDYPRHKWRGLLSVGSERSLPCPASKSGACGKSESQLPPVSFPGCITDYEQKITLLELSEINYLWIIKTNQSFLKLSADSFIARIYKHFQMKELIVGEDFRFGYKGKGCVKYLEELAFKYHFELSIVRKKRKNKKIISSSAIRELIKKGGLKEAKKLLGRNFSLKGRVIEGKKIGTKISFPTANVSVSGYVAPLKGVYAAYVVLEKRVYLSAVNIGVKPTVTRAEKIVLEAHIINFRINILGKIIEVVFLEKIRKERKFTSLEELKTAIQKDIDFVTSKYSAYLPKNPQLIVS